MAAYPLEIIPKQYKPPCFQIPYSDTFFSSHCDFGLF